MTSLIDGVNDFSQNGGDTEYIQTKLSTYINQIQGPEDIPDEKFLQLEFRPNPITDADGDGVHDNI